MSHSISSRFLPHKVGHSSIAWLGYICPDPTAVGVKSMAWFGIAVPGWSAGRSSRTTQSKAILHVCVEYGGVVYWQDFGVCTPCRVSHSARGQVTRIHPIASHNPLEQCGNPTTSAKNVFTSIKGDTWSTGLCSCSICATLKCF